MKDRNKSKDRLLEEISTLRKRVSELEERKYCAQQSLLESQKRFYDLADSFPVLVFETDTGGTITYFSRAGKQAFGYTIEDFTKKGIDLFELFIQEDRERARGNFKKIVSGSSAGPFENTLIKKNGEKVNIVLRGTPIIYDHKCIGIRGLIIDITKRKKAEEALRESRERFRALTESTSDWIWEVDENAVYTYSSPKVKDLLGFKAEEIIGKTSFDLMTPEDSERIKNELQILAESQKPFNRLENENVHKSGRIVILESSGVPIFDAKGIFRGFRGIDRDITEPKIAENMLRESEERWRLLVENIPDIIVRILHDGTVLAINRTVSKMTPEEAVGQSVYNYVAAEYRDELKRIIHQAFQTGNSGTCQVLGKGRGGVENAWYEMRVVPMELDNKIVAATLISTDITETKKYQKEKEKLQARLQIAEKMEAVGILAGGVAHDLNNILASLVSYPDLLLLELPEDSPLREPILTIQQSGQKAAAVVHDLLSLARRGSPDTETLNLNTIITEYLSSLEYQKLTKDYSNIVFETNLKPKVLNIIGSAIHLSKVIHNLVSNAAEAIVEGGKITITTSNKYIEKPIIGYDMIEECDYTILCIADNGCGIPEKEIGKIFDPFYTKKIDGRLGTGLGLSIVWGTVKDHKGYIDVKSTEGKGTAFYLYFPATKEKIVKKEKGINIENYKGNGETILVIDDIKEQRQIACSLLSKMGYSPKGIPSGEEAVEYMKENSAHLLVLDMIMGSGIDGLETYKRTLKLHPGQKAIITSGFSETERVREAQRLGAGQYIKKPYDLETLAITVKNELDK